MVCLKLASYVLTALYLVSSYAGQSEAVPLEARQTSTTKFTTSKGTSQCVELVNDQAANGIRLQTDKCSTSALTQQWQYKQAAVSGMQVLQTANNMCLDVKDGLAANGTPVQAWQCNTKSTNQFWSTKSPNMIQWNGSNYCLDIANGVNLGFPDKTPLQIWQCDANNANQKFIASTASSTSSPTTTTVSATPVQTPVNALTQVFNPSSKRMLAWGYDNNAAPLMANGPKIGAYHHWQDPSIPQMPARLTYIPTYWGVTKKSQWNNVKADLHGKVPKAVMGFNEPDVPSQANMSPASAAREYYNEITKNYAGKGSILISPSVAWDIDNWSKPFMQQCNQLNCQIDAMGMHIYLSLSKDGKGSVDKLISVIDQRVTKMYNAFKKPVVVGELGLTSAGGGSDAQMLEFMQKAAKYLDNSPHVLTWALSAVFRKGQGWDGYLNSNLAFFDASGKLTTLGKQYMSQSF